MEAPALVQKYGHLAMLLFALRHDLDIYCLITANAENINKIGYGRNFFEHLQRLVIEAICLNLCKIFEKEKGKRRCYDLNSIEGVLNQLTKEKEKTRILDSFAFDKFIQKYGEGKINDEWDTALRLATKRFRLKFKVDLGRFESFRHQVVAHSEYGVNIQSLPSYDVMEQLFEFGEDFYALITRTFLDGIPFNLRTETHVKTSLESVLRRYGLEDIKTVMEV